MDSAIRQIERNIEYGDAASIVTAFNLRRRTGQLENWDVRHNGQFPGKNWSELLFKHFVVEKSKYTIDWLVATNVENQANYVYCRARGNERSDGYGGATFNFALEDGSKFQLQGPWHSNSSDLFKDTGYDVRQKHYTFCVIGTNTEYSNNNYSRQRIVSIIHKDKQPTLGHFYRGDILAGEIANMLGQQVYIFSESEGGSHSGTINPGDLEKNTYWRS